MERGGGFRGCGSEYGVACYILMISTGNYDVTIAEKGITEDDLFFVITFCSFVSGASQSLHNFFQLRYLEAAQSPRWPAQEPVLAPLPRYSLPSPNGGQQGLLLLLVLLKSVFPRFGVARVPQSPRGLRPLSEYSRLPSPLKKEKQIHVTLL